MPERDPDEEDRALRARLDKLASDLKGRTPPPVAARPDAAAGQTGGGASAASSAMSLGLRAGGELVSAVVLGAALGWGLDWLLHTKPLFIIVFFMLGAAAGLWNVIRVTSPKDASFSHNSPLSRRNSPDKDVRRSAAPPTQGSPPGADDDED